MSGDSLLEIIAAARLQMPDVPDDVWRRFETAVRTEFGATRVYIAAHKKRRLLREIAMAETEQSTADIAKRLGISQRRVQQLRRL